MDITKKRAISKIAAVFVCISVLFSFVFIAGNAVHECTHDGNCAVCRVIDVCVHTIRGTATGSTVMAGAFVIMILCAAEALSSVFSSDRATLISLKVELRR